MKAIEYIRWADPPLWKAILADLLPLWLLSFTITAEGFPHPPISAELAIIVFALAIAVIIVLAWLRWLTPELFLYSLFPFILLFTFDEIATSYKTSFILVCALALTIGVIGYQLSLDRGSVSSGWLILLLVFIATWMLASHASQNYWHMVSKLGYGECFPGEQSCPLTGNEAPWWVLFFRL